MTSAEPTKFAAAVAGAWAGFGTVTTLACAAQSAWGLHRSWAGVIAGLVAGLGFVLIPGFLSIVGRGATAVPWAALRGQIGRQALLRVLSRGLVWAASAAALAFLSRCAFDAFGLKQFPLL
jgi:hypothetical protein